MLMAITAKVTGEQCRGVLTRLELAEIELYLVRQWVWWARHALERDAHSAIDGYKAAEQAIASGMEPKGLNRGRHGQGEEGCHPGAKVPGRHTLTRNGPNRDGPRPAVVHRHPR